MIRTAAVLAILLAPQQEGDEEGPTVVARINDEIITSDEVEERLDKMRRPTPEARLRILRDIAERRLLQQEARRHRIEISEEEVDEAIEREVKRLGGQDKLKAWIRFNKITHTQYREQLQEDILVNRLYQVLGYRGFTGQGPVVMIQDVSPEEIREYYVAHRKDYRSFSSVRVLRLGRRFQDDAEKQKEMRLLQSLHRRLKEGYEFAILAQYYTEVYWTDTNTAEGRPTFYIPELQKKNDLFTEETTDLLFGLEAGEPSGVVEDGNTLNLFVVESRTEQREVPFEEAQAKIRLQMRARRQVHYKRLILKDLVRKAYYEPRELFAHLAN